MEAEMSRRRRALAIQIAMLLPMPALAVAQQQEPAQQQQAKDLDAVIVTATHRGESLQDVPISITAVTQEELNAKGIVGYEGMAQVTPGVVLNRASANFNNFTARGIATNGYNANLQSTVAVYIDELPISASGNSTVLDPSLFDVERVEFLRGPQGTLFGSGSLAGALRILTNAPNPKEFEASFLSDIGVTASNSLRQRHNAMVNIPLAKDTLALRVVGFSRDEQGYIHNLGTGVKKANKLESWGGRATLLWQPNDDLTAQVRVSREESKPEDSSLVNPALGKDKRYSDRPDMFSATLTNYNLTVGYQLPFAKLTSSSTWSDYDSLFNVDLAGTYNQAFAFALDAPGKNKTFVQEVRLVSETGGAFDWVLGGYYFKRDRDVNFGYRSNESYLAKSGITGLPDEYYLRFHSYDYTKEQALFGELTYHVSSDFWLTAGLRYGSIQGQGFTREGGYDSDYLVLASQCSFNNNCGSKATLTAVQAATGIKARETGPSWRLSASWRPIPSITTYATVSTGFRAPVVNTRAGSVSAIDPSDLVIPNGAESDKLINYEAGLKGRWFAGRLAANLALYYIDWKDIQVQANRVSDSVQFATNIDGAFSRGVEFELVAMPTMDWTFTLNGSFNKAEVNSLSSEQAAVSGAVKGARLSGPQFNASLTANYAFDLPRNSLGNASVSVVHVGSYPGSFPNVPGNPQAVSPTYAWTESYTVVNANLSAAFDKYTVGLYVENLFNDRSINYVHPEAFLDSRYGLVRPRTWGLRVGYSF